MFYEKFYKLLKQAVEAQAPAFMKSFRTFKEKQSEASKEEIYENFYKLLKASKYRKF